METAVAVHHPDLALAAAVAKKGNRRAIGRPGGVLVPLPLVHGQLLLLAAIGAHNPNLIIARLVADIRDPVTCGRPHRVIFIAVAVGDHDVRAITAGKEDVGIAAPRRALHKDHTAIGSALFLLIERIDLITQLIGCKLLIAAVRTHDIDVFPTSACAAKENPPRVVVSGGSS